MSTPTMGPDIDGPLRLQPVVARPRGWRGRSGSLVAVALVGFVMTGLVLGATSDKDRPSQASALAVVPVASSHGTASPRPAVTVPPLATPLPTREALGSEVPTERRFVYADGLELLDLATGSLTRPSPPLYDVMLPIGDDQVVCACVVGGPAGSDPPFPPPIIRFGRFEVTGRPLVQRDVLSFDGVVSVPNQTDGFNVATALSEDRRTLFVLTVARQPPMWSVDLNLIDVETGALVGGRSLGRFPVAFDEPGSNPTPTQNPDGTPPDGAYAWAAFVAPAPDGRTVMASVQTSEWRNGSGTNRNREWMVPIREDQPELPIRLKPDVAALDPNDWCTDYPSFVDQSLAVQVCANVRTPGPFPFYIRRLSVDGTSPGDLPIEGLRLTQGYLSSVLDRGQRSIVVWDPVGHTIARVDVDTGQGNIATVPEEMRPGRTRSRGYAAASPALVLSPDGRRMYAVGSGEGNASSGVWVFDDGLGLIEHWEPRAVLNSIAISADGHFVYVTGAAGFDADGNENRLWQASITVYDALSGEEQVLYGAVATDTWMTFPNWH